MADSEPISKVTRLKFHATHTIHGLSNSVHFPELFVALGMALSDLSITSFYKTASEFHKNVKQESLTGRIEPTTGLNPLPA